MKPYEVKGIILLIFAVFLLVISGITSIISFYYCLRRGSAAGYWSVYSDMSSGKAGVLFAIVGFPIALSVYVLLLLLLSLWSGVRKLLRGESIRPNFGEWKLTAKSFKLQGVEFWLAVVPMVLLVIALVVAVLLAG